VKLAASGKGGVGKTTVISALARLFADRGQQVFAIDADPDSNLTQALGLGRDEPITPLCQMRELIAERTGASLEGYGQFFKLNPHVDDIPDAYSRMAEGIRLLVLGAIHKPGGGCYCPENVFLKQLLAHLVLRRDEVVLIDLEAGIEHVGRATTQGIDAMLIVVEPGQRSITTGLALSRLAREMGVEKVLAVANKVSTDRQEELIRRQLEGADGGGLSVAAVLHYHESLLEADLTGDAVYRACPELLGEVADLVEALGSTDGEAAPAP
jgi:CO dehydrogenase maturation factor